MSASELHHRGFGVLRAHLPKPLVEACREAFWPTLLTYLATHREIPNRRPGPHFLLMPFEPPCYAPEFFFGSAVLRVVHEAMDDRVVADQWRV